MKFIKLINFLLALQLTENVIRNSVIINRVLGNNITWKLEL